MRKHRMVLAQVLAAMLIGLFTGCAGTLLKDMGSFRPSTEATEHFEKTLINDDYNYFISGSEVFPLAIFGLKKSYVIDSDEDFWGKVEPSKKIMAGMVLNMQLRLMECCKQHPQGFDILDNQGRKIGEWYSMLGLIIGIQIKEEGKVVIYPPLDTDEVKRYQGRRDA